jgi:hypothetical protein
MVNRRLRRASRGIILGCVWAATLSCVGAPSPYSPSVPVDLTPGSEGAIPGDNVVIHGGVGLSVPAEWRFSRPDGTTESAELLRAVAPDGTVVSLYRFSFGFTVDEAKLSRYVRTELSQAGRIVARGVVDPLFLPDGRGAAQFWTFEDDRGPVTIILENDGAGVESAFLEWRIRFSPDGTGGPSVPLGIVRTAWIAEETPSTRMTPAGFGLHSIDGVWQWAGDAADGLLVEKMVAPTDTRWIVAILSQGALSDRDAWWDSTVVGGDPPRTMEIDLDGRRVSGDVYRTPLGDRSDRTVIAVHGDATTIPAYIICVRVGQDLVEMDGDDILVDPAFRRLLDLELTVPPGGSP